MKKVFCTLRDQMKKNNLNIKKLQEKTSLSRTTISNLINQYSNGIQFDTVAVLCDVLDCQPGDLLVIHNIDIHFFEKDTVQFMELTKFDDWFTKLMEATFICEFILEGNRYEFEFNVECKFSYRESNPLDNLDIEEIIPSVKFKHFVTQNNFPNYIQDFLEKSLENYVIEWVESEINN